MEIRNLNHVNIRTDILDETRDFFIDILGLKDGFRPELGYDGYWLYQGDTAVLHLSDSDPDGDMRTDPEGMGRGLDHVGFAAKGYTSVSKRLKERKVDYITDLIMEGQLLQIFFNDPNGVTIELGFNAPEEGVTEANYQPVGVMPR